MHKKINILFFLIGALLAILGGVFEFSSTFSEVNLLILILIGVFIGLMNIDVSEEAGFLLSAMVFLFSVFYIAPIMSQFPVLENIAVILTNLATLIASATAIVSLRWVLNFTSNIKKAEQSDEEIKKDLAKFEHVWAFVMLVAVAVVLIQVVLEFFFETASYQEIMNIVDYVVLVVFVIDLGVIYKETQKIGLFFKNSWLDIIATIPFNLFMAGPGYLPFRFLKLVRISKIAKIQKASKLVRVNRGLKFFSKKSKFNVHLDEKEK